MQVPFLAQTPGHPIGQLHQKELQFRTKFLDIVYRRFLAFVKRKSCTPNLLPAFLIQVIEKLNESRNQVALRK